MRKRFDNQKVGVLVGFRGFGVIRALLYFTPLLFLLTGASGSNAKIEKARELVLKGDRVGAVKLLKELPKDADREAWREVAEVFLTDKGQNQFSLADSYWMQRPKDAADLLLPLLKVEDGNLSVSRLGARASLRALDCVRAETFLQQAELIFPIGTDVKLLRLQVNDCLNGNVASAAPLKISLETDGGEFDGAIHQLLIKDAIRRKDLKAARVAVAAWEVAPAAASGSTNDDPEFSYWKWRVSPETSRDRVAARKYIRLCKEMTPRRRKNFAMYPELCLHTETVESDLKSGEKAGL